MIRILFIDDEPNLLSGLRRMLHGMRNEWEMDFADSGAAALDLLSRKPVDVLVTDMRMPEMDGAMFLERAVPLYPGTIRLILSGEADAQATSRVVRLSHQFLPKPCNLEQLIDTVRRTTELADKIPVRECRTAVTKLGALPTPTGVADSLRQALDTPAVSLDRIAEIFAKDVGLAAKILQLANTAYFGIGQGVFSPARAVEIMGLETIEPLIKDHDFAKPLEGLPGEAAYLEIWSRSIDASEGAAADACAVGCVDDDIAIAGTAALLKDVGRLILCLEWPEDYADMLAEAARDGTDLARAEERRFGVLSAAMSAFLAGLWGLPEEITAALSASATDDQGAAEPDRGPERHVSEASSMMDSASVGLDSWSDMT